MIIVKDLPTGEGTQFVVVWTHNGKLWSDTYRIQDGKYMKYSDSLGGFREESAYRSIWQAQSPRFRTPCTIS